MWFEQKFTINEKMAEEIKFALKIRNIVRLVAIAVFLLGLVLVIISSIIKCCLNRRSRDRNLPDVNFSETNRGKVENSSPLLN